MALPFFETLRDLLAEEGTVTVGELLDAAGEQTYGLLVVLLALPSLIPAVNVPAAPVGGAFIMGLGWQMARGRVHPSVPVRLQRFELHRGRVKEALARMEGLLSRLRWQRQEKRALPQRWMGLLLFVTGFLLAIPVPLPLGNILPAGTLCLQGFALLEERPALGWLGALGALGIALYFALSFGAILKALTAGIHQVLRWAHA
jgi:hypothetical protein